MPPKMTANPVRPARYRAGKPTAGQSSSSESEASADEEAPPPPKSKPKPAPRPTGAGRVISTGASLASALAQQRVQEEETQRKARADLERKAAEEGFETESEGGESEGDESEGGSGSGSGSEDESSAESSSSEEAPRRLMGRPKFVSRAQRSGTAGVKKKDEDEEAILAAEEERKKAATDAMVEEQIRKDLAARAAGKKHWDDDDDLAEDINTEDDVDPEAEYAAWKLRELRRIKRQRERIEAREHELEEVARRRNLTEEERAVEDEAHLARQQEEKEGRGKMEYLQKYYHRGVFFQDDTEQAALGQRDIMGARFADDVRNRELLPEALQMRDMTKLGKKGASKYKDLKTEDTGQWGRFEDARPGKGGFDRFGDDRVPARPRPRWRARR